MNRKEVYDCYVECWKQFLQWCDSAKDGEKFDFRQMIIEADSISKKYEGTQLSKFCNGLLQVLMTQVDDVITNNITIV